MVCFVTAVHTLTLLQDSLGELNDLVIATAPDRYEYFANLDPITAARLKAQLDEVLDKSHGKRRKLLKQAETALHKATEHRAW